MLWPLLKAVPQPLQDPTRGRPKETAANTGSTGFNKAVTRTGSFSGAEGATLMTAPGTGCQGSATKRNGAGKGGQIIFKSVSFLAFKIPWMHRTRHISACQELTVCDHSFSRPPVIRRPSLCASVCARLPEDLITPASPVTNLSEAPLKKQKFNFHKINEGGGTYPRVEIMEHKFQVTAGIKGKKIHL